MRRARTAPIVMAFAASLGLAAPGLGQVPPVTAAATTGVSADPCAQIAPESDQRLTDFGQLCRYRTANAALLARGEQVETVFFGDSITEGWMNGDGALFTPGRIDRGISGQTTAQMLVRFRQDVIALRPGVVHILAGTNDIAGNTGPTRLEDIAANIASMAELARAHGIKVIIAALLPAEHYPWRPEIAPAEPIRRLNTMLRAYAARERLIFVDYYHPLANDAGGMDPANAADGVHPTAAGYRAMRPLAAAAIAQALGARRGGERQKK